MKKIIILLNDHLSHFWFLLLMGVFACFIVFFLDPQGAILVFGKDWNFGNISTFLGRLWILFLLPLFILSLAISIYVWTKGKENNHHGLIGLIIAIISLATALMFISKLSIFQTAINNGTSIFSAPLVGGPETLNN
jgi:hypothetical protein